jgi:hypothetical protein
MSYYHLVKQFAVNWLFLPLYREYSPESAERVQIQRRQKFFFLFSMLITGTKLHNAQSTCGKTTPLDRTRASQTQYRKVSSTLGGTRLRYPHAILTFKTWIKSHQLFAGIISSRFSPR